MNFVSNSNATALMQAIADKFAEQGGAYKFRGSVTFANLPTTLTESMMGYVYNVNEDFTTTNLFIEGAGKKYSVGTNVAVAEIDNDGTKTYLYDVIGSFVDVDALNDKIDAVEDMISGAFDATEAYSTGDIVVYNDGLYKFKADHSAGAWDATEVDTVTVTELLSASEPDALTPEQVNALIALL